ncbi:hypothetical protein BU16DRAFT_78349 [Lophium mytilinum]|uniref:PSP1 C-terminal domain-containing protein n=1 Tax=Lophium mytilinum TaxID=390894 RepID=A0A6A6QMR2_9PEZI|nr:hypothetical protein BU16DRAFT_78349 [Lophium mytilinum]
MSHAYKKPTQSFPSIAGARSDKQQARRPTPDSEVLASSDEDASEHVLTRVKSNPLAARRQSSSWLNDIQPHRKVSLGGASQTGNSQPPTPVTEQGMNQPRAGPASFPWNAGVFTSTRDGLPSPTQQEQADPTIGFLLNQKPVRKAVRSLSYSVGQQDDESASPNPSAHFAGRGSRVNSTSVRHRPSKPSLLGEAPLDSTGLPQLLEDDDDVNSNSNESEGGLKLPASYWGKPDTTAEGSSNALLRQAAEQNARARHRASATGSPPAYNRRKTAGPTRGLSLTEFDSAIEEMEDQMEELAAYRRYSEHAVGLGAGLDRISTDTGIMDSPKKPHWTTSLNFGDPFDTHSRRHSFADVKSHQSSKMVNKLENTDEEEGDPMSPGSRFRHQSEYEQFITMSNAVDKDRKKAEKEAYTYASEYFDGTAPKVRKFNEMLISAMHPDPYEEDMPGPSNTSNPYAVPEVINRPTRRFYMVAFKCSRSDVYYLPENTGLELQQGDMVVTEGDRGIDLGTVTHADVTLTEAKRFKEIAAIEHFRWLMMFSRHAINNGSLYPGPDGMLAASHQPLATALGHVGAGANTLTAQYLAGVDMELKPRIIRRVAANHEVQVLREKEGSEAKAKRICQAKVAEHGLNMEILDAEYQLDYKKLTFYYYADAYINFNELVTDLFKVYKTRIWMSAVNPASFASAIGTTIPPPSAIGPGAIGSKSARSTAPRTLPQDFNAPLTSAPLPMGLGYTRPFQYNIDNDEFGSYRDKVSMMEDAKKIREGLMPFNPPGFDALNYRLPEATPNPQPGINHYAPSGSQYSAFEHQVPRNYPVPTGGYMFGADRPQMHWDPQAQQAQGFNAPIAQNQYRQQVATSRPSPTIGVSGLAQGGYPTSSHPSPVPSMGSFPPPGNYAGFSRPSPLAGLTVLSPPNATFNSSYGRTPTTANASYGRENMPTNPQYGRANVVGNSAYGYGHATSSAAYPTYTASSFGPEASGHNGQARSFYPNEDWTSRMGELDLSSEKRKPSK